MECYQNDAVAEGYQNDRLEIKCEYVYDQGKDVVNQNDRTFSSANSEKSSDKDDTNSSAEAVSSDMKTSKTSKKKKRRSRYDEENYALPDPETDDQIKIRKLESKANVNQKQARVWRATSFLLTGLLLISATVIAYFIFEKINVKGNTTRKYVSNSNNYQCNLKNLKLEHSIDFTLQNQQTMTQGY